MAETRRPWLAALLAVCYPGLGHVYLREYLRALLWFAIGVTTALLVVPEGTTVAGLLGFWSGLPLGATVSLVAVTVFGALDAYMLATQHVTPTESASEPTTTCPNCRHEVDPDLAFCHWCTEPLPGERAVRPTADAVESGS